MDDASEHRFRRWLLEEATGKEGATVTPTVAPSAATEVWRYPYWPTHDVGYEEDEQ